MRVQPPKTRKRKFTLEEFREYLFNHVVVGGDKPIPLLDFLDHLIDKCGSTEKGIEALLTMLPAPYHFLAGQILTDECMR